MQTCKHDRHTTTQICNGAKDGFIAFKAKQMAKSFEVHLHPHKEIDLNPVWDDLTYEGYSLEEPAASLPLPLFSAQPVIGKKVICLHLQPETDDTMSIIIQGKRGSSVRVLMSSALRGAMWVRVTNGSIIASSRGSWSRTLRRRLVS